MLWKFRQEENQGDGKLLEMSHIGIRSMMAKCRLKRILFIKCVVCSLIAVGNHWFLWNFVENILARKTDYLLENNEYCAIHFE